MKQVSAIGSKVNASFLKERYRVGEDLSRQLDAAGVYFQRHAVSVLLDTKLLTDTQRIADIFSQDIALLKAKFAREQFEVINARQFKSRAINLRESYLSEHVHEDHEIRWFLAGTMLLYLNLEGKVHILPCRAGDLVVIPPYTRHWIDMGPEPDYCCVTFYNRRDSLVNQYTGSFVAESSPRWESLFPDK